MKNIFVETPNSKKLQLALSALERRGAREACLMVIDGVPGLGKTATLNHWAEKNEAIYLRASSQWHRDARWFLFDLLGQFRVHPARNNQKRFAQALEAMLMAQSHMSVSSRSFVIVIDEADHISRSGEIMELIRDFSDRGEVVFVLVGMGTIRDNLARFPQISSRVSQYVRFEPAGVFDVRNFFDALCEVPVDDDLIAFTHKVTGGLYREIQEAIGTIETVGKRNKANAERPVRLSDLSGQRLINNRKTGAEIMVPKGV